MTEVEKTDDETTAARRDEVIKRMLATPPQPRPKPVPKKPKG
jgi:hypothetical protein